MDSRALLRVGSAAVLTLWVSSGLAAAPIRVTGRVLVERAGLSGAQLELFPAYEGYAETVRRLTGKTGPVPVARARTDAAGDFEIIAPESGCFRLEVRAEGYLAQEIAVLPLVEDVELPSATLVQGSPVEVRTVGPDGRPLAGIEVQPFGSPSLGAVDRLNWELISPRVTTGSAGRGSFLWFQPYGPPPVIAVSPRFLGQMGRGKPGEAVTLRLVPARSGWVEARDAGGRPVPGALARWNGRPVGITGPDGRLEIAVPEQASALTLENGEGWGAQVFRTVAGGLQPVRLEPLRRITGRVVDALSRKPVAGAVVWSGPPLVAPAVRSGKDGTFVLTVPAAEVWLNAGAAGFLPGGAQDAKKGAVEPLLLKLAPSTVLSGTVVDGAGRPVTGAVIKLYSASWGEGAIPVRTRTRSQAGGGFRFSQLPPGESFELWATHPGFAQTKARARTAPTGQPSPPVRIVMADGRTAFGRVVDEEDRPIAGAQVTLSPYGGTQDLFEAMSDGTGRFEIRHLPPGDRVYLKATYPGYAAAFLDSIEIPSEGPDVDLGSVKMSPAVAVEGRVTDSRAQPIEGAEVLVEPDRTSFSGGSWVLRKKVSLRTGADGSFRAGGLEKGRRYDLEVHHEGHASASVPGVEAPTAEPLRIEMEATRVISGQVVGPAGEPVAGASLSLFEKIQTGNRGGWGTQLLGTTDEAGRFRVSGPPSGSISLQVSAEGYAPRRIEGLQIPEDRDLADLKITLSRGGVLDVRVLNRDEVPVGGAWVSVSPAEGPAPGSPGEWEGTGFTDSTGQLRLAVPEAGAYRVAAKTSGATAATTVRAVPGPDVTPVELRFSTGVAVSGRVIGEDGAGTAGAAVSLVDGTGRILGTSTEPGGSFIIPLVADGDYRLQARWEESQTDPLDITVGGSPVQGLELRLRPHRPEKGRASLTVRILGLTPEEISEVRTTAFGPDSPVRYGRPDRDGLHRFEGLRPGSWNVTATTAGDRRAQGTVQIPDGAGEAALDLVFRKGLTLTGRVLVDGAPLSGGSVKAWSQDGNIVSARTAHDGTFTLGNLTTGSVALAIEGRQGFAGLRTIQLTEDQEISISLSTGRLAGRVLTAAGEPVEEATVSLEAWLPDFGGTAPAPAGRTGVDGTFDIPGLGAGTYQIKVFKAGFAPAEATAVVPAGGSPAPVEVVLRPQEGALQERE